MNKEGKIVTILLWVLLIISAVMVVSLMANISENDADPTMGSWVSTNLVWSYILLAIGAGIVLIAGLYHMISDIKAAKGGLVALVFFAVIFGISYAFSSDAIPQFVGVQEFINSGALTAKVSKLIDTGLYATYILLGLAVLSIVYSSVNRLFK
jgi:hypothetical protein